MRMNGTFEFYQPGQGTPPQQKADLLEAYPDIIRAGAAWRLVPQAELRFDVSWQRWSEFQNQCVVAAGAACNLNAQGGAVGGNSPVLFNLPRNWQDTVKLRLGGAYWVTPETELFGSFAFETSPVQPKDEDPLIFDSARLYGTAGAKHVFSRHFYGALSYTYVYFLPVTVTNSAYYTYKAPSTSPSEDGSYAANIYLFDASLGYVF
jgi:long-chain fatty acid transport protein